MPLALRFTFEDKKQHQSLFSLLSGHILTICLESMHYNRGEKKGNVQNRPSLQSLPVDHRPDACSRRSNGRSHSLSARVRYLENERLHSTFCCASMSVADLGMAPLPSSLNVNSRIVFQILTKMSAS